MGYQILDVDAFIRSVEINRKSPHAIFLGAGASISSGVPSANACVNLWKKSIFETKNPAQKDFVSEISLPAVQERINRWLKANEIWPEEGQDDYGYFIRMCLPIEADRRNFFATQVGAAKPHIGYRLLCLLAEEQVVRSVWTTNFDGLVGKASAESSMTAIEIGIDCQQRADRQANADELLCYSLHGDFRYDKLKNTEKELQNQEEKLRDKLVETLKSQSLIVSGYSGRDPSIMKALDEAIVQEEGVGKVYWCGFTDEPDPPVAELLGRAHQVKREAFFVPGVGFDELAVRLSRQCLSEGQMKAAIKIIGDRDIVSAPYCGEFKFNRKKTTGLIKSNALKLSLPSEAYSFGLKEWPESQVWKFVQERAEEFGFAAVPFRAVIALGTLDQIKEAFAENIDGDIERSPITNKDLELSNGAIHSLVHTALLRSIAARRNLNVCGRDVLWEPASFDSHKFNGVTYAVHRCVHVRIRCIDGEPHMTLDPSFFVPAIEGDSAEGHKEIRKNKLGYQHNDKYDVDLKHWLSVLAGNAESEAKYDFPPNTAAFQFGHDLVPSFGEIEDSSKREIALSEGHKKHVTSTGKTFPEPNLMFATLAGWDPTTDTNPIRGLANFGPFDTKSLVDSPLGDVNLSVICPQAESKMLQNFLSKKNSHVKAKRQGEYLVDYKGFSEMFKCALNHPTIGDANWFVLPEISEATDALAGCRELTKNISERALASSTLGRSVVLVLTPDRWAKYRRVETDDHVYDVHDDVKAYAARQGISTQFLDQSTLSPYDPCRIWWWLSLAIYTKAMRTPWVLQSLDENSAFVGLGYSVDRKSTNSQKIVLGCSHLYNAQGQGLQFRLRNIQDASLRRDRNPYLSFNESRQMAETIRQLFWESHQRLPERVVIHKLFPFSRDEIKGIKAGLSGIKQVELLEINHEPSLRYLNSRFKDGRFSIDGFPVRRGTALRVSKDEMLLWVHGATSALTDYKTYFQGKRRIPAPVVVRRYAGSSDVSTIVNEILGLSKMDWNSGDLYSQLPATVQSSRTIARIGRRLAAVGQTSFDYRLFM